MIDFRKSPSWPISLLFLVVALFLYTDHGARTQFAQNTFAGTSSGTANAQTITLPNISQLSDILNQSITFRVNGALTNTGPTTLAVSGLTALAVHRSIIGGTTTLSGAELAGGHYATVMYDGTQFQLLNSANPVVPGTIIDWAGAPCPTGYLTANSATASQATYPALFGILGTLWGPASGGNFTTPDLRARATYGQDQNVGGLSNRISVAGGNFSSQTIGNVGGQQNWTLLLNQMPTFTPTGTTAFFTPSGSLNVVVSDTRTFALASGNVGTNAGSAGTTYSIAGGTGFGPLGTTGSVVATSGSIGITTATFSGNVIAPSLSIGTLGGDLPHPTLGPSAIVNKCIRA